MDCGAFDGDSVRKFKKPMRRKRITNYQCICFEPDINNYCLLKKKIGDGECQEGSVWEIAMMASGQGLENLIAILDCNRIQKMDFADKTLGNPEWRRKWESFGWLVDEVDGHNMEEFKAVIERAATPGKPRLIIAYTIKGKGISIMEPARPCTHAAIMPNKPVAK